MLILYILPISLISDAGIFKSDVNIFSVCESELSVASFFFFPFFLDLVLDCDDDEDLDVDFDLDFFLLFLDCDDDEDLDGDFSESFGFLGQGGEYGSSLFVVVSLSSSTSNSPVV